MKDKIVNIDVEVKHKDDLYNKYSDEVLPKELREYISDEVIGEPFDAKIVLNLTTHFRMSDSDKKTFDKAVRTEYKDNIDEINLTIRHDNIKELLMFFVGLFLLVPSYMFKIRYDHIIAEIVLIFGWVAIWEVAYSIMFVSTERKLKLRRLKQLYKMEIEYK